MTPGTDRMHTATSDVPDASRMEMPSTEMNSGTMMKPPPTPTYPPMKPMLYVANVDEDKVSEVPAPINGQTPIPICAEVEAELAPALQDLD